MSADAARGLGGQPVVQPNGTVIVPYATPSFGSIRSFRSVDGGTNWRVSVLVSNVVDHPVAGGLRSEPLPSAEIDRDGKVLEENLPKPFPENARIAPAPE